MPEAEALIRLNKAIADSGYCARRKADALIEAGRVQVNGQPVSHLGHKINPRQDTVTIDGQPLPQPPKTYLLFHKPVGTVTSRQAGRNQRSIYALLPSSCQTADPAGRLDQDSSGALILSNDGDFLHRITHPRFHWPKRYQVELDRPLQTQDIPALEAGIMLQPENKLARMQEVWINPRQPRQVRLTLVTGYNRQIRRSFEALGYTVGQLHRLAFGPIELGRLPAGGLRPLRQDEIKQLLAPGAPPEQGQNRPQKKDRPTQHHRQHQRNRQAGRQGQGK